MKSSLTKKIIATVLAIVIAITSFVVIRKVNKTKEDANRVEVTVQTTSENITKSKKDESETEAPVPEDASKANGEKGEVKIVDKTGDEATTSKPKVTKYTGGALPSFSWEQAQKLSPNYFGESVFIGDSVSLRLKMYGGLPGATYLCYGSFGSCNALSGTIKANIWNCINGKKRVYIMLGMNDLNRAGVSGSVANMRQLCSKIVAANPGVLIYIQSMTPIIKAKDGTNGKILNNNNIRAYNQQLSSMARANGWYFVDVASVMYNDEGYLKDEYCGDPNGMGLHFTSAGCATWCWYLKNHCYDPNWSVRTATVKYVMKDGSKAPATQKAEKLRAGDSYSIASPMVKGYTPDKSVVKGTIGTEDIETVVTYTKDPRYTLTVKYVMSDGTTAPKTYTKGDFLKGDTYSVSSPKVDGYKVDKSKVSGTFGSKDITVTVKYTLIKTEPITHTLKINYILSDGGTAPAPHTATLAEQESYSVTSPEIEGYTPDTPIVSGKMGTSDITVDVTYTKIPD